MGRREKERKGHCRSDAESYFAIAQARRHGEGSPFRHCGVLYKYIETRARNRARESMVAKFERAERQRSGGKMLAIKKYWGKRQVFSFCGKF